MTVGDGYVYVADGRGGFRILDPTNPQAPTEIGFYDADIEWALDIITNGDYAYVVDAPFGVRVFNLANRQVPVETGYHDNSLADQLALAADHLYAVRCESGTLRIMTLSTPTQPLQVGSYSRPSWVHRVVVVGDRAYLVTNAGLVIMDVSDPTRPREISIYGSDGSGPITISAPYAYFVDGWGILRVVDVSDPSRPKLAATYYANAAISDFAVQGYYLYVLCWYRGLQVVDISNPELPILIGAFYDPCHSGQALDVVGPLVYITESPLSDGVLYAEGGLRIVDVSDPKHPTQVAFLDTPGIPRGIDVEGPYAYVADSAASSGADTRLAGGLRTIDVSKPYTPVEVSFEPAGSGALDVTVTDGVAFVFTHHEGAFAFSISDPARPLLQGMPRRGCPGDDQTAGVAVSDEYALFAKRGDGLTILRLLHDEVSAYIPPTGGRVSTKAADATFTFPSGSFSQETAVTYRHFWVDPDDTSLRGVGRSFEIEAMYHSTSLPAQVSLPYTAVISYTLPSGIKESTLALYHWDGVQWTREATSALDTATGRITASLDHFGLFAVLGEAMTPTPTPTSTPTITPTVTPTPAWQLRLPIVFKP